MTFPPPRPLRESVLGATLIGLAAALVPVLGLLVTPHPPAVDRTILAAIRGSGPAGLRRFAVDLTALGSGTVLTLVVLAAAVMLLVRRQPGTAAMLVAASWSGGRVVDVAKTLVARARPDVADRLVQVSSASFPSAHAANSAVVYLTLAALAGQVTRDPATRRMLFGLAILLVGAIGTSRVYLGVHWPTDVLGGWTFGSLWALGWWRLAAGVSRRGARAALPPA